MRFPLLLLLFLPLLALAKDRFPSFSALARHKLEGTDFKVVVLKRRSPVTSLAIHGGLIEPFTEKLAEGFAGTDFNLYTFEALSIPGWDLHVTATHFDDWRAVEIVTQSDFCVSFHGEKSVGREEICVGGTNQPMRSAMAQALVKEFPEIQVEFPCQRLPGVEPKNIGNRCKQGGVQLEFSMKLLKALQTDPTRAEKMVETLRATAARPAEPGRLPQRLSRPPPTIGH